MRQVYYVHWNPIYKFQFGSKPADTMHTLKLEQSVTQGIYANQEATIETTLICFLKK